MMIEPCDIIVCKSSGKGTWKKLKTWVLGSPYEHVFMYLGDRVIPGYPLIYESAGRGVTVRNIAAQFGRQVVVMRLKITEAQRQQVIKNALEIAFAYDSYYDYLAAGHLVLILLLQKLHLPIPLKYQRNSLFICSEAVAEAFWRAGIEVLPRNVVPSPGDFVTMSISMADTVMQRQGKLVAGWI